MDLLTLRVARPPARPLMIWDGECHFCGGWIRRWQGYTGGAVDYETFQSVGTRFAELGEKDYAKAVYLVLPDGRVFRGAEAVFESLNLAPGHGWGLKLYHHVPGFKPVSEWFYRGVAQNRQGLSLLTKLFIGDPGVPSTYRFSGMLFLRLLGLIFLVAFVSFWGQAAGLVGDHGIIPVGDYFNAISGVKGTTAASRFWSAPSLLWFFPNSFGLNWLAGVGSACSLLLMAGLVPGWALLGCVITYASLRNGVPVFLNFQWDALLVESGFVALLIAPWGLWQRAWAPREPSKVGRWLTWWLLFKLMFMSGLVKILTNDNGAGPDHPGWFRRIISSVTGVPIGKNTWLDGTALQYHYFTQPIPASTSWWFHNQAPWFQAYSLWLCMFIELVVPFAFLGPRRLRHLAALLQIFLQVALLLSGNYGFFNLLTIVLCIPLFDDTFWPKRVRKIIGSEPPPRRIFPPTLRLTGMMTRGLLAGFVFFVGLVQFWQTWDGRTRATAPAPRTQNRIDQIADLSSQLGIANSYGLFRVMTTERPEIVIEGSTDGVNWREYSFVWKPGDPMRQPTFTTPHMPRLDWQMWFAALQVYYDRSMPQWLPLLCNQLRAGNPAVLALLDQNPFAGTPPEDIRLKIYLYHFTTPKEHDETGAWWTRTLIM
jgi:lipase maturation factor 1